MDQPTTMTVKLGIFFLILFSAYNAFQNIVTKIHSEDGDHTLGPFALAMNFSTFMITNLFASRFFRGKNIKWFITFPALGYGFFYSTGFFIDGSPKWEQYIFTGIGAAVGGFSASFVWIGVGIYIHKLAHHFKKEDMKGKYFGVFNMWFSSSSIIGACIVTFALSLFSHKVYFSIVGGVGFLAFLFGFFFIKEIPEPEHNQSQSNPQSHQNQPIPQANRSSVWEAAKKTLSFYPKMKYALPLIIVDGLNIGASSVIMLKILPHYPDSKQQNLFTGFCLMGYGIGSMIGGFLGGKLCDLFKIKVTTSGSLFFFVLSCGLNLLGYYLESFAITWANCFTWGVTEYSSTACLMVICSRLFGGQPESFAVVKQLHSFVFVVFQIVIIATDNQVPIPYLLSGLMMFWVFGCYGLWKLPAEGSLKLHQNLVSDEEIHKKQTASAITNSAQVVSSP